MPSDREWGEWPKLYDNTVNGEAIEVVPLSQAEARLSEAQKEARAQREIADGFADDYHRAEVVLREFVDWAEQTGRVGPIARRARALLRGEPK